jgi:hypothetical protein
MKIKVIKMELSLDKRRVNIFADGISINLSVLHLAQIFGVDEKVVKMAENSFGSEKLENEALEIKKIVERFPNIDMNGNDLELDLLNINKKGTEIIITAEGEINGWGGEVILISLPLEIYKKFERKKLKVILGTGHIHLLEKDS